MRYTHAIVVRIPNKVRMETRIKVNPTLAEKQLEELCETLREVCISVRIFKDIIAFTFYETFFV